MLSIEHVKPKRFADTGAARQFRAVCRDAVRDGMGQELVNRWEAANLAMTGKLRIGGSRPTPVDKSKAILAEEAAAWDALSQALPQSSRIENSVLRAEAAASQGLEVGQDTNARLKLLQQKVEKMGAQTEAVHGLLIQQKFTAGSPETTAAQADTMIASLKQVKAAAKIASKAEAVEAKTKLAAAKAEAKTNAAAAKEDAKTNAAAAKETAKTNAAAAKDEAKTKAAAAKAKAKAAAKKDAIRQIIRNR